MQPPEITGIPDDKPVIFLGGPIQGAPDWQSDARDILHGIHSDIIVASPRKDYAPGTFDYEAQVVWERQHLRRAGKGLGAILFYLPRQSEDTPGRAYGQTSRFELGWWLTERAHDPDIAITIGLPGGFGNERYIRHHIAQEQPDIVISETLEMTCFHAVIAALPKLRRAHDDEGWGAPEGSYASSFAERAVRYREALWRQSQPYYDQMALPEDIRREIHAQLKGGVGLVDARALAYRVLTVCQVALEPGIVDAVDTTIRTVVLDEDGGYSIDQTLADNPSLAWQDALGFHE